MENNERTILCFSAELQKETEHTVDIDGNGEVILTCTETGRFLKFPKGTTATELKAYMEAHKNSNQGQITVASLDEQKSKLLDELFADEKPADPSIPA